MTSSHDVDIEEIVRRTLSSHAGGAPPVDDTMADRVIGRGRVVRRRRRVAGAAAGAVASLAVVGSVWGVFGHRDAAETMPASGGPAAVVPRADLTGEGLVLRLPGRSVPMGSDARSVRGIARSAAGFVVVTSDRASARDAGGTQTLSVVDTHGRKRDLVRGPVLAFAVSPDGERVAYVGGRPDGRAAVPRIRSLESGQELASAEGAGLAGVESMTWDGGDVLVTRPAGQAANGRSLFRWSPGRRAFARVPDGVAAVPVPGARPLVVVSASGRECLRRPGSAADIVCGQHVTGVVAPDRAVGLVHVEGAGGAVFRLDVTDGRVTKLAVPQDVAGQAGRPARRTALWQDVAWTGKGVPLVRVVPQGPRSEPGEWRSVDLRTGAMTAQDLPDGVERTISW